MSSTVEVVDQGAANAYEQERDRKAWNLPARPQERDIPLLNPDAENGLDWEAFSATYFPGSRRHDLGAIVAYAAYKRGSPEGSDHAEVADRTIPQPPLEAWE